MSESWYCKAFGQELGPMSFADLLELVERADVLPTDDVKCGAGGAWRAAGREARLFPQAAAPAEGGADTEFDLGESQAAAAAETEGGPNAAASAAAPSTTVLSQVSDGDETPSGQPETAEAENSTKPSRRALNRKLMLACAGVLAICAASAGAGARLLLGDAGSPPAAPSGGSTVEQQKIALLKQQIDDLKRQRDEFESAAGSEAPGQPASAPSGPAAPSNSAQPSGSEQSPPSNDPPGAPAPADGATPPAAAAPSSDQAPQKASPERRPAAVEAPKGPALVQQQGDSAIDNASAKKSRAAQSSNQPTHGPPATKPADAVASSAPLATTIQNGPNATSLALQAQERRRQRVELLRQIYKRRAELLVEYKKLEAQAEKLKAAVASTETAYAEVNAAGAAVLAQIGIAQTSVVRDAGLIQSLMQQYAALDGEASQLKIKRQKQAAEQEELTAKIKQVDEQAAELRSSWLAAVDPFGQLDRGDEDAALASFTEWTTLEPERPGPWLARGFAYWQLGQFDKALGDFNMAVKLAGPMLTNSLSARGGLLYAMQRSKEAMADFGQALKLNKADGMIYLFRGRALCADDKYQSGVKDFKTAIQLNPKDAEAHRNLALVLAACPQDRFRNGKRAVKSATEACELTEWKNWTALDTLAAACAEAGDFDEACRWVQKAAGMTDGANRKQCLARLKQYQAHRPLRLDWNSLYGSPSAAADAPITQ